MHHRRANQSKDSRFAVDLVDPIKRAQLFDGKLAGCSSRTFFECGVSQIRATRWAKYPCRESCIPHRERDQLLSLICRAL
jgi:hypothetical protein